MSRPRYTNHAGFLMPGSFPVAAFDSSLAYAAQPGDVFITTYPKCGTTWMQHIVYLILHDGQPMPADERMTEVIPHLEEVGRDVIERLPSPRVIKTHLPLAMTPWHDDAKYVYVARNPFDCVVSFFHHTRGFVQHYDFADGTFDDYFELFVRGEIDFGDYFDNLVPWYARRDDANVLFVTYEAMKADLAASIAAVGTFLGGAAARTVGTPDVLASIVGHATFDAMRRDPDRWASRRPEGMPAFIRKGEVGDWANYLSREQARRLAAKFDERAVGTGLADLWPDILAAARG